MNVDVLAIFGRDSGEREILELAQTRNGIEKRLGFGVLARLEHCAGRRGVLVTKASGGPFTMLEEYGFTPGRS